MTQQVALVTGGAKRLGKAIALALADHGYNIVLHYHQSGEEAQATAAELRARGAKVALVQGDLALVREVQRVVDEAAAAWGRLDVLINSAAIFFRTPLADVQESQWDALINTNLKGPFFCAQRAAQAMQPTGGVIINFADTGLDMAWKEYTPYLISKAGIAQMTYGMARELAPGIRVNAVAPGPVLMPDDATEAQRARAANSTLVQQPGSPQAVVDAVLYLIKAEFVTGVVLPVDGGQRWK